MLTGNHAIYVSQPKLVAAVIAKAAGGAKVALVCLFQNSSSRPQHGREEQQVVSYIGDRYVSANKAQSLLAGSGACVALMLQDSPFFVLIILISMGRSTDSPCRCCLT